MPYGFFAAADGRSFPAPQDGLRLLAERVPGRQRIGVDAVVTGGVDRFRRRIIAGEVLHMENNFLFSHVDQPGVFAAAQEPLPLY